MNGFEPLRRRIIDYTEAGQWSEVYDGLLEDCESEKLKAENAKLREAVATAIKVQAVLCGDADSLHCRNECPLHRPESNDCLACDVIEVAQELRIEVDG